MRARLLAHGTLAVGLLLGAAPAAYALGDSVIPQTAGLIIGGPLVAILFLALLGASNRDTTTGVAPPEGLGLLLLLGLFFNAVWLGLLLIFNPATWSYLQPINLWQLAGLYLLPVGGLAVVMALRRRTRSAILLLVTDLIVWMIYWQLDVW